MKTTLETIEEYLSKSWNRGCLMTISDRLSGHVSYCIEIKGSKNYSCDRLFLKKEECQAVEEIINKYNKIRLDAQREKTQKTKQKAIDKKAKLDSIMDTHGEDLSDIDKPEDDIEDEIEDEIPEFSEKLIDIKEKEDI